MYVRVRTRVCVASRASLIAEAHVLMFEIAKAFAIAKAFEHLQVRAFKKSIQTSA